MRSNRSGQILFLEFAITLPIFGLLMIGMMTFHKFHTQQIHEGANARRSAWISSSAHISGKSPVNGSTITQKDMRDGLKANSFLQPRFDTRYHGALASREVKVPKFMGNGIANGRVDLTQDPWAYEEIQLRGQENGPDGRPVSDEVRLPSVTGGKDYRTQKEALYHQQAEEAGDPVVTGQKRIQAAAFLFYGQNGMGPERQAFLKL
jgi:hypothetical protein